MAMRRLAVSIVFVFTLASTAGAVDFRSEFGSGYGTILFSDDLNISSGPVLSLDFGENFVAASVAPISEQVNNFSLRFVAKNRTNRNGVAIRGKYLLSLPIGKTGLRSESSLALGALSGYYSVQSQDNRFQNNQVLYGSSQYLKAVFGSDSKSLIVRAGGFGSGSTIFDDYGSLAQWDSFGFGANGLFSGQFGGRAKYRLNGDLIRQQYNPERYFFVKDWTNELSLKSELTIPVGMADLIPSINYKKIDIERDRLVDLERLEYGGTALFKNLLGANRNLFAKAVYAPMLNRNGADTLGSVGVIGKDLNLELFQKVSRSNFSSFEARERLWGIKFSWKFPNPEKSIPELDHYGYVRNRKSKFYVDSGLKDDSRLTLEQQAERLGTLRKRNEWSDKNLMWKEAPDDGWGFREARDVYADRGGDCDEQSCQNAYLDFLNGYKSYQLNWYDLDRWIGHGVQLVQDPGNGQWFLDEYGVLYKVKVDPNAPIEEVGREALRQNSRFTAMPITKDEKGIYYYEIDDCTQPGTYQYLTDWISFDEVPPQNIRPQVEYGYELLGGRRFLFED
ncbi:MAG: hypothetical protein A3H63_02735 [Candidatus Harrisonbacteria bacterium RIFCSPLOWO2_02_FULL_45_10c]|nr:MAG: hypothetical protein A3H63_02735 [Candidatus Harrisonbacteria bacterium RIFCSPLOWO2_02_FULL_45_10c]